MFVYRNPTTEERAEISKEHGGVDWSSFPAPPDKGGLTFLEEHAIAARVVLLLPLPLIKMKDQELLHL